MRSEKEILEQRARVHYQMQDLLKRASDEKRTMTDDESAQWDKANADFSAYTKELDMVRTLLQRDGELNQVQEPQILRARAQTDPKAQYRAYFERLLSSSPQSHAEAMRRVNADDVTRAVTSTQNDGAYVIPEEFMRELEVTQKAFGGMLQASRIHRSVRGGTMNWPTIDDTSQTGNWQAEPRAAGLTSRAFTFSRKQFGAHLWSDIANLTWEFIQDEDVMFVASYLAQFFGEASGRALNNAFTDGNGSGKPTGILDATGGATTGKTTASNTALDKKEFIDLVHSVDPAYRTGPNVAFMFSDNTLASIRKLDFGTTDDEPIWQPSFAPMEPDRILGYPYVINQAFPNFGASKKFAAFGDWSKYVIRMVKDFELIRLQERYADYLEDGFLGWLRVDGKLIQPAAIKLMVGQA
jgi:HK97 family phage major capsid protein